MQPNFFKKCILVAVCVAANFVYAKSAEIGVPRLDLLEIKDALKDGALKDIVCASPQSDCQNFEPAIFALSSNIHHSKFIFAFHENKLLFQKIERLNNKELMLLASWDLNKAYENHTEKDTKSELRLHPALYPVSKNEWAIAFTSPRSEMYSGGGGHFTTADFIVLKPQQAVKAILGVPFSCSKLMRACFSEKDYKNSKRCHDEIDGDLDLKIIDTKKAIFNWKFSCSQTELYAKTPSSKPVKRNHSFSFNPHLNLSAAHLKKLDFCGASH